MLSHAQVITSDNKPIVFFSTTGIKKLMRLIDANPIAAKNTVVAICSALTEAIKKNNFTALRALIKDWKNCYNERKFTAHIEAVHSYLNSTDVKFSGKYDETHYFSGEIKWVKPGNTLNAINQHIELHMNQNKFTQLKQSLRTLVKKIAKSPIAIFTTLVAFLPAAAAAKNTLKNCPTDASPLAYAWQEQCPARPPTRAFMNAGSAKIIENSYLVYSNWPLTHAQVFAIGATHGYSGERDPNEKLLIDTIDQIADFGDHFLLEGAYSSIRQPCSVLKMLSFPVPTTPGLICQGWELKVPFDHATSSLEKVSNHIPEVTSMPEELRRKINRIRKDIDDLAKPVGWFEWFVSLFFPVNTINRLQRLTALNQELTELFPNAQKGSSKLRAASQAMDICKQWIIAPRNQGILQTVASALKNSPDNRIYIKAGTLHFFTKNSMDYYHPSDEIAKLRDYFKQLDSQGKPVALLYPKSDAFSVQYQNDGKYLQTPTFFSHKKEIDSEIQKISSKVMSSP